MEQNKGTTVYVGLSGGVDSSVAAALLKDQGYTVVGIFIDVWQPEFTECTSREDRRDAMRVCAQLGIDFKRLDCREAYKQKVVDYMIGEYARGRTPNPDVMCNKYIKFGLFFEHALSLGADKIATGHYARINHSNGKIDLMEGVDPEKDQSYFLWAVDNEKLSRTIFPVGGMLKSDVRKLAHTFGLPTAKKKDSQGVCFLGKVDMREFLSHSLAPRKGEVLSEEGDTIGEHEGAWFYTRGQRHGFTVEKKKPDSGAFYVIDTDVKANTLRVSNSPEDHRSIRSVTLTDVNWITKPRDGVPYEVRYRYRQNRQKAMIDLSGSCVRVIFNECQKAIAPGQSLVLYSENICYGGGIIDTIATE